MENKNLLSQNGNDIEKAKDKAKTLDDVLAESVGKWGWFQVWFGIIIYLYESAYAPCVDGLANKTFDVAVWDVEDNRCPADDNGTVVCSEWAYDDSHFSETVSMKWDIVCDNRYLRPLSGTLRMFGLLIGS